MPIQNYGVWVAKPIQVRAERADEDATSPHIHLLFLDQELASDPHVGHAAINVKSKSAISELVFWLVRDFRQPMLQLLQTLSWGFHPLSSRRNTLALDYLRGQLMDLSSGLILPHDRPGRCNDIIDFVLPELEFAIAHRATVYLFGGAYTDRMGMHDIHMNQGGQAKFRKYNGVGQDGGVILSFPDQQRFDALFFAFATQAIQTDDRHGHPLPGSLTFMERLP